MIVCEAHKPEFVVAVGDAVCDVCRLQRIEKAIRARIAAMQEVEDIATKSAALAPGYEAGMTLLLDLLAGRMP